MALLAAARGFPARLSIHHFAYPCLRRTLGENVRECLQSTKPYTCLSTREEFKIRLIKREEEFESVVINAMVKEGWRPGLKDAECFLACAPISAFVGELNGKPICCLTLTNYGDNFAYGGCHIVSEGYRGKGYGREIANAALASLKPSDNVGTVSSLQLEEGYTRMGFRSLYYGAVFVFHLPAAITHFSETSKRCPVKIKRIEEVDLEALFIYDTRVFGYERRKFLSKWLDSKSSHVVRVAVNSEGSIVGYTVARPTLVKESYKIGPLFADSEPVAEKLLKAVFEEILRQEDPAPVVCIDALTKNGTELCEKLQGERPLELVYMVMNDPPDACFDKWFGITTTQLG